MMGWLSSGNPLLSALVVVGGVVVFALLLAELVRRGFSPEVLSAHNDLAGFILAVVGVVYAVLLGFVAIGVWERFDQAEVRTYHESGELVSLYRNADGFSNEAEIRSAIRTYVHFVITAEWEAMQEGRLSPRASASAEHVAWLVRHLQVRTLAQANLQSTMLTSLATTLIEREERLYMDASGINAVMWWVLLLGAGVTVGFTTLFGFKQVAMRRLMIGALALSMGLVLYLTVSLDFPFRGAVSVGPGAFTDALVTFDHIDAAR